MSVDIPGEGTAREDMWRELVPHVLARLLRTYGRDQFEVCEDAVQDAVLEAHRLWQTQPPADQIGWLVTAARRRYVDRVRSDRRRRDRESRQARLTEPLVSPGFEAITVLDDSLLILQLCCHPELSQSGQVALTLRAVCGLTTAQIAAVSMLPEATVAQRITRAKRRLNELGRALPGPQQRLDWLPAALKVLYLMFTEAHHTTSGTPAHDRDLAVEAIRLAGQLRRALPADTEVAGLHALMLLTESRQLARVSSEGNLIPLDEQDRSRWNQDLIREGLQSLDDVVPGAQPGPYLIQACIAGLHAQAPNIGSTDWRQILALYRLLEIHTNGQNPTVSLNRIVAQAMVYGPRAALGFLAELQLAHPGLPRIHSVRADLLRRAGDLAVAAEEYRVAIKAAHNVAEQRFLLTKLHALADIQARSGHPSEFG